MNPSRRRLLTKSAAALVGAGLATKTAHSETTASSGSGKPGAGERRTRNRVGAVAYGYQYSIGLFSYKDRPGDRFDAIAFIEADRKAGGEVAQIYHTMIRDLDEDGLKPRTRANENGTLHWLSEGDSERAYIAGPPAEGPTLWQGRR